MESHVIYTTSLYGRKNELLEITDHVTPMPKILSQPSAHLEEIPSSSF